MAGSDIGVVVSFANQVEAIPADVRAYLEADRIRHEPVLASLLLTRRSGGYLGTWWARRSSQVLGLCVQKGSGAELSRLHAGGGAGLAAVIAESDGPRLERIHGLTRDIEPFCDAYAALSGRTSTPGVITRLMEIWQVTPPPRPAGARRPASTEDLDLIVEWLQVFDEETGTTADPAFNRALAAAYIRRADLHLWDGGQGPVAATAVFSPDPAIARLVFVYTPAEHRGRGYASRLVAEVAQDVLARGAACILFTDPTNRTSTRIYERTGFRPVDEFAEFQLD